MMTVNNYIDDVIFVQNHVKMYYILFKTNSCLINGLFVSLGVIVIKNTVESKSLDFMMAQFSWNSWEPHNHELIN